MVPIDPLTTEELLAPVSPEEFFQNYWETRHLVISRNNPDFYRSVLEFDELDRHFQSTQLPAQYLRMVRNADEIPPSRWAQFNHFPDGSALQVVVLEKVLALYEQGTTIVLNAAEGRIPSLGEFSEGVVRDWHLDTAQANLYLTPPNAQGFAAHLDRHCVLILQIHGEKTWKIYPMGADHPIENKEGKFKHRGPGGALVQEVVLRPGDLLYLPRGQIHEACTSDAASLHVTLGLFPKFPFRVLSELGMKAGELSGLRQGIVFGPGCEARREAIGQRMAAFLHAVDGASLPGEALAAMEAKRPMSRQKRFSDVVQAPRITADTVVSRRQEVEVSWKRQETGLDVKVLGKSLTAPLVAEKAFGWMNRKEPFVVRELPALLLPHRKATLVAELVKAGLLRIERI